MKSGQARVLTPEQFRHLMNVAREFTIFDVMSLPASYTKGANANGRRRSASVYDRKTLRFSVEEFHRVLDQVADLAHAGAEIDPTRFYPDVNKRSGKSRDLPLVDPTLREALQNYVALRIEQDPYLKPTDPLFITQKGGSYSPNTLQEHMALMLRGWAGIEKASSHSGRRTVATDIIHGQGQSIKVAQKALGHKSAATTAIYEEPPEEAVREALRGAGEFLDEQ